MTSEERREIENNVAQAREKIAAAAVRAGKHRKADGSTGLLKSRLSAARLSVRHFDAFRHTRTGFGYSGIHNNS